MRVIVSSVKRILIATALILLSSTAALADRQYHVVVLGMP